MREVVVGLNLGAGANLIRWDGTDRDGRVVEDGLYLVTVEVSCGAGPARRREVEMPGPAVVRRGE